MSDIEERESAPDLRDAVTTAIDAMDWLTSADQGLKALALRLAHEIESARDRSMEWAAIARDSEADSSIYKRLKALESSCDAYKAVGWLGPQLQSVLRDLAGSPAGKRKTDPQAGGGRVEQFRNRAPRAAKPAG